MGKEHNLHSHPLVNHLAKRECLVSELGPTSVEAYLKQSPNQTSGRLKSKWRKCLKLYKWNSTWIHVSTTSQKTRFYQHADKQNAKIITHMLLPCN